MTRLVPIAPLTASAFEPFGRVIEAGLGEVRIINGGTTERHHALCHVSHADGRQPILSIFRGQPRDLPMTVAMMERHPLGSQAFVPLDGQDWIAVVAEDVDGRPGPPRAFLCGAWQGVSYDRNVWHHPLIALGVRSDFLVADTDGADANLEEADYQEPYQLDPRGGSR